MTDDDRPARPLPVRTRPAYPGGRHRRSDPADLPPEAPALVIAVPGPGGHAVAEGLVDPVRAACPGVAVRLGAVPTPVAETVPVDSPKKSGTSENSGDDTTGTESSASIPLLPQVLAELAEGRAEGSTTAVVVPLLTGPHERLQRAIAESAESSGTPVIVTDALGPHPLLAGALHEHLAAKGLARADRMRMLSLVTSTDGVIIVTVGGIEGATAADMTAVLLASRLAVPVVPAALDGSPGVADVAARLRETGAARPAIAPCVIGPELAPGTLEKTAADAGLECADPLGPHPAVARLISLRYELGLDDVNLG